MTAFAFQCQDCGHLESPEHAGDRAVPLDCRFCDIGSHLEWRKDGFPVDPDTDGAIPFQVLDRPNPFTILADLPKDEQKRILRERADPDDTIVRHVPVPSDPAGREPRTVEATAEDRVGLADRA